MSNDNSRQIDAIVMQIIEALDRLPKEERLEAIDDLLHRFNFERRLTALTEKQLKHMTDESLSETQRERIDTCKTKEQRDEVIEGYARATYFRRCAWSDYLNGVDDEPPVPAA